MIFWKSPRATPACLPQGKRVYAIGDIHGQAALLIKLLRKIRSDSEGRDTAETTIVILGDFIDRGHHAAKLLRKLFQLNNSSIIILKGNHEASLVQAYRGDEKAVEFWLDFGGVSTLVGLGVTPSEAESADAQTIIAMLRSKLDDELIEWLDKLPTSWSIGDYYFAHAGIRPRVPLERQSDDDLLWIRHPFISSRRYHGKVIVHGHTIEPGEPKLGGNRIGLDTGAHEHGQLTALGLEADQQWLLQVSADISISHVYDGGDTQKRMASALDDPGNSTVRRQMIAVVASGIGLIVLLVVMLSMLDLPRPDPSIGVTRPMSSLAGFRAAYRDRPALVPTDYRFAGKSDGVGARIDEGEKVVPTRRPGGTLTGAEIVAATRQVSTQSSGSAIVEPTRQLSSEEPHLSGAELTRALKEDSLITRQLNLGEQRTIREGLHADD